MKRDLAAMASKEYDLIVVGGGIFGICTAWDAALRGLSVALVEQGDFGHATSANHFKMVHGGIRYLQHADFYRVRESSRERSAFLRVAPHLVSPLPIAIPTYGHGMKGQEAMAVALQLYSLSTYDRNKGIGDPQRQIPVGHLISRQESLREFPYLPQQGLTGAVVFHDGQMYNPPRLSLAFLKAAVEIGAETANYVKATGFLRNQNRVVGITAEDRMTGDTFELRGQVVVNAAGPWADRLLGQKKDLQLSRQPVFSRDAYFMVKGRRVNQALAVQGATKDPDAILSRGNRHLFLVPWRDYTLVGVWHVVHQGAPEDFKVTETELQGFLTEINGAYPGIDLKLEDVSMINAGLTLFGENEPGATHLSYGKRSILVDHTKEHQIDGLITLIGVRFTTARGMAEKAIDLAFKKLGRTSPSSETETAPVYGGRIDNFNALVHQAQMQQGDQLSEEIITAVVHNHGSAYTEIFDYARENQTWLKPIGDSTVLKAEVLHAVREEMALTLEDVVFRRTDLGTGEYPGEAVLQSCAALMASELGWNAEQVEQQVAQAKSCYPDLCLREERSQASIYQSVDAKAKSVALSMD